MRGYIPRSRGFICNLRVLKQGISNPRLAAVGLQFRLNRQYLTNLEAKDYTAGQLSRRLYGVPWNTSKVEYYIKIDVNGLNVIQNNSYNFLIPGNNSLNLHGRIVDSGISIFRIKF